MKITIKFLCLLAVSILVQKNMLCFTIQAQRKPVTVFIHGMLSPWIEFIVRRYDVPLGFTPALTLQNSIFMGNIPFILNKAAPDQFPLETFYLFGWSGYLSFEARKLAAEELYFALKKFKAPITLIGHSHGGNVALNLADVVKEFNDPTLSIERLILLASPVQVVTEAFIRSPLFKQIFSFYSTGDFTQIIDPEGIYKAWGDAASKRCLLFSRRTFEPRPNLIQIATVLHGRRPAHLEFIAERFLKHLPNMLSLFPTIACNLAKKAPGKEAHFAIYIPRCTCNPYQVGHIDELIY